MMDSHTLLRCILMVVMGIFAMLVVLVAHILSGG